MRHWLVALLGVLALALSACGGSADASCDERIPGVRPGVCLGAPETRQPAPETAAAVLGGDDGEQLSVADFRGQVLVLNFWASWCGPCRAEQPELNAAADALPDDAVAFLGVNVQDSETNARAHAREFDIPYPSLFDPDTSYTAAYEGVGPRSIPSTVIIDQQGRVAARLFGTTSQTEVTVLAEMLVREGS